MKFNKHEYNISNISSSQSCPTSPVDYNISGTSSINKNEVDSSVSISINILNINELEITVKNQLSNQLSSQVWLHFTRDINFKTNKKTTCNYCIPVLVEVQQI